MTTPRRILPSSALAALAAGWLGALASGAGCEGTTEAGPGTPSAAGSGGGGGEGGSPCNAPPDDRCDGEADCECLLCQVAAVCTPFGCMADGSCDPPFEDSCTCSDCDWDAQCLMLDRANCHADGTCDYLSEGCTCPDCQGLPACLDNAELCAGGAPDGACEPERESCHCLDCLGAEACLCVEDCLHSGCVCPVCWGESYCDDPAGCWNDGWCDWYWEGCPCPDCTGVAICAGYTPGTGGGGGAGGGA